ncbi:MAG: hypothetical protein AAFY76_03965, partial [Cyanobacteria bacterium J06649_11]
MPRKAVDSTRAKKNTCLILSKLKYLKPDIYKTYSEYFQCKLTPIQNTLGNETQYNFPMGSNPNAPLEIKLQDNIFGVPFTFRCKNQKDAIIKANLLRTLAVYVVVIKECLVLNELEVVGFFINSMKTELANARMLEHPYHYYLQISEIGYLTRRGNHISAIRVGKELEGRLRDAHFEEPVAKWLNSSLIYIQAHANREAGENNTAIQYYKRFIKESLDSMYLERSNAHYFLTNLTTHLESVKHLLLGIENGIQYGEYGNALIGLQSLKKSMSSFIVPYGLETLKYLHRIEHVMNLKNDIPSVLATEFFVLLGECYKDVGKPTIGLNYIRNGLEMTVPTTGDENRYLAYRKLTLAELYLQGFDPDKTLGYLGEIKEMLRDYAPNDPLVLTYQCLLGKGYTAKNDYSQALFHLTNGVKYLPIDSSKILRYKYELSIARTYFLAQRYEDVINYIVSIYNKRIPSFDEKRKVHLQYFEALSNSYLGNHKKALEICEAIISCVDDLGFDILSKSEYYYCKGLCLYNKYLDSGDLSVLEKTVEAMEEAIDSNLELLKILRSLDGLDKYYEMILLRHNHISFGKIVEVLSNGAQVFNDQSYIYKAIDFLEQTNGAVLENRINNVSLMRQVNIPDSLIVKRHTLSLAYFNAAKHTFTNLAEQESIGNILKEFQELERFLVKSFPQYKRLTDKEASPSIAQLQE